MKIETTQFIPEKEKIIYNYYVNYYKDESLANKEYNSLWYLLDTDSNHQLVTFGKIVFLLKFQNNKVEFHSMGKEPSIFAFANDVRKLINYVKQLGIKEIYSYSNDRAFELVIKRLNMGIKKELDVGPDGLTYTYYRLEF
jgi:hypothetical protein